MGRSNNVDRNSRKDLEIIASLIKKGDRMLDLGCGDGLFLHRLQEKNGATVLGMEISQDSILRCIANGVPVIQSDLDNDLDFADDGSFDMIVVSQTLQEMRRPDLLLKRIVRAGKRAAVSFINFGHWECRLQLLFTGKMPRNSQLPYHWYDTPNIHLGTIKDFRELCDSLNIKITQETPIAARFPLLTQVWSNMFAVGCVFVIEQKNKEN